MAGEARSSVSAVVTVADNTNAPTKGASVGTPPGKLAIWMASTRLPVITQSGSMAPTRPATAPAIAA
ncbi:MAG: hypothetical protein EP339_02225 [Gammaproteobacteria bacterium]|nr:MAG: hypothetical protein EP339_02225 [Gammaproteobacteria bacterium]